MKPDFIEQATLLGPRRSLLGIVTKPVSVVSGDRPMFVILNTGIIHRVGHSRMFVTLSRLLAEMGYTVLRFDLSGLGDSDTRTDGLPPLEAGLADIREAIDGLETAHTGRRIILLGLCSGADYAVAYGHSDPRVVGLVLIDPSVPSTWKYYVVFVARNLLHAARPGVLWRRLNSQYARALASEAWARPRNASRRDVHGYLEAAYRSAVERGVQILAVFASGVWVGRPSRPHQHNYSKQLLDAFPNVPFGGRLRLRHIPTADHIFSSETDRMQLFDLTLEWVEQTAFPGSDAVPLTDPEAEGSPAARAAAGLRGKGRGWAIHKELPTPLAAGRGAPGRHRR